MSDLRAQKLEAARKQLKAYQSKPKNKKEKNDIGKENIENAVFDAQNLSTGSNEDNQSSIEIKSFDPIIEQIINSSSVPQINNSNQSSSSLKNYFNSSTNDSIFEVIDNANRIADTPTFPPSNSRCSDLEYLSTTSAQIDSGTLNVGVNNIVHELELKLQQVSNLYETEKNKNNELQAKIVKSDTNYSDLKLELEKLKLENSSEVTLEMSKIKEQLQTHIQTVGVLVGEKAELSATVGHFQQLSRDKNLEVDELQSRLNASRYRVQELERELGTYKQTQNNVKNSQNIDKLEVDKLTEKCNNFKLQFEDAQQHLSEYKENLYLKNNEISQLQSQLETLNSDLNLSKLKLEQLTEDDSSTIGRIELLNQQHLVKDKHIAELQESLTQMNADRENNNVQYQNFVLHLNQEVKTLADKVEDLTSENGKLLKREENLVKHISDLEKQLQQHIANNNKNKQLEQQPTVTNSEDKFEDREKFTNVIQDLQNQLEQFRNSNEEYLKQEAELKNELEVRNSTISDMQFTIERLQQDKPDSAKLIAEMESDKIAASRAVLQNQDLKSQLEEMQRAFVQMSNDKLDLTDKLQTEQHLCREMKSHYNQMETDITTVRDKLHYKDEEMIRLAHENTELKKEIYLHNQELDQLRHYEARNSVDNIVQIELQNSRAEVLKLQKRIEELESDNSINSNIDETDNSKTCKHDEKDYVYEIINLKKEKDELVKALNVFQNNRNLQINSNLQNDEISNEEKLETMSIASTTTIPNHEAMEKLQERFKRTMTEIADMTEEKHRLEHLVLQLQGETETIGEYITLYQNQRRLLKQKEIDRDMQLKQLAIERKLVNDKLNELKYLVEKLITDKSIDSSINPLLDSNNLNNDKDNIMEIAEKILSVFHDLKTTTTSSNSVQNQLLGGVHLQHCSCCSGRLETV